MQMKIDLKNLSKASLDFIEPMLAKSADRLPTKGDWLYEVKLDGYRALVIKKRAQAKLFSRRCNSINRRFPTLADVFDFLPDDSVIDGELLFWITKASLPSRRYRIRSTARVKCTFMLLTCLLIKAKIYGACRCLHAGNCWSCML
jgi:ATP-dependent DNA ligase